MLYTPYEEQEKSDASSFTFLWESFGRFFKPFLNPCDLTSVERPRNYTETMEKFLVFFKDEMHECDMRHIDDPIHSEVAYHKIITGSAYHHMHDDARAMACFEEALTIEQRLCDTTHLQENCAVAEAISARISAMSESNETEIASQNFWT